MVGERLIRPRRSLPLGHDDCILSPLARSRYSFPGSSSTMTSSTMPGTLIIRLFLLMCRLRLSCTQISFKLNPLLLHVLSLSDFRLMIHEHVPRYFLENTLSLPIIENLGTEVLSVDAHPVHHVIHELSLIVVLLPLLFVSLINFSMEDIDEGIEEALFPEQYNKNLGKEFYANLSEEFGNLENPAYGKVYIRGHVINLSPFSIEHYLSCPHLSDIEGTGVEEEVDFDEVTKVLTGHAGVVWL
ncbi:hypothetical protein M9H77_36119 [Catharanthus roseus]|uniref:Uncharacterized protein n=1 Tax=Catharanthus roseus TaxID=4058 RepID=A0ACB9ZSP6_CATRO|nr:hypothetical protein M9H77_36119 [Catharanthus roseus]